MSAVGIVAITGGVAARWVKSSCSGPQGNCAEVARPSTGEIAVRNSRYPDGLR